jgi:hypothetical protein
MALVGTLPDQDNADLVGAHFPSLLRCRLAILELRRVTCARVISFMTRAFLLS